MKRNKSGISLIVLVITIIVMIILAATIIISLSNNGIINRANQAVNSSDLKQVQHLASLIWADAYLDEDMKKDDITKGYIEQMLTAEGVDISGYDIIVEANGVEVKEKEIIMTLGSLISNPETDYGKYVNYSVTAKTTSNSQEKTYDKWRVYYEDEKNGYVYIITDKEVEFVTLNAGITVESLTTAELELYKKFQVNNDDPFILTEHSTAQNCKAVAQLIKNYGNYANKEVYGEYVIGAIGAPTIELLAAGWNEKEKSEQQIKISRGTYGYLINDADILNIGKNDGLYVLNEYTYWIASPSGKHQNQVITCGSGLISWDYAEYGSSTCEHRVYPVVCLKSDMPAKLVNGIIELGE